MTTAKMMRQKAKFLNRSKIVNEISACRSGSKKHQFLKKKGPKILYETLVGRFNEIGDW